VLYETSAQGDAVDKTQTVAANGKEFEEDRWRVVR
jgi:hypothetical protein